MERIIHIRRNSIGKNVLHLFSSTAVSSILNLFSLILLAKYLESEYYGMFSVALALAMVLGYFTDVGLSVTVLREGSKNKADLSAIMSSYIKIRIVLLCLILISAFFIIQIFYDNSELIKTMYFLIGPMVVGLSLQSVGITYFQLVERMQYLGFIRILASMFLVLSISLGMWFSVHYTIICFLYGFSYFLSGLVGIFLVNKNIKLSLKSPFQKEILQKLWIFLLSGLLMMLLPQIGPIVLENTLTLAQVGLFAIAFRIPSALYQIPGVIAGAFYPALFRYFNNNDLTNHLKLNLLQIKIMSLIGMSISVILFHMSEEIIMMLFGLKWIHAAGALKIMSIIIVLQSINVALADGLTTQSRQLYRTLVQFCVVVSAIFLFSILSKIHLVNGAAIACLLIETISLIGFLLANPFRLVLAKKVLIGYLSIFSTSLVVINILFKTNPLLAIILHNLIIVTMVFVDKTMRNSVISFINNTLIMKFIRRKQSVNNGT